MTHEEIDQCLQFIHETQYGSVVLQSGELTSQSALDFVLHILQNIREKYPTMGITLSLGELPREFYKVLKEAGADRHLFRIETSNPHLYQKLHPSDHSFERRKQCLYDLKELGFQVGTGNMVGVPGQTVDDLVNDLRFFKNSMRICLGLVPIFHEDTPLEHQHEKIWWKKSAIFWTPHSILLHSSEFSCQPQILPQQQHFEAIHPRGRIYALQAGQMSLCPA